MMNMMGKLKETQQKIEATKQRLDTVLIDEKSNDGLLEVTLTANRKIKSITIDESLLQDKRDMIEDLPVQQASLLLLLYIYCSEVPDDVLDAVVSRELELTFSNVVTAMDAARRITVLRGVEREQT